MSPFRGIGIVVFWFPVFQLFHQVIIGENVQRAVDVVGENVQIPAVRKDNAPLYRGGTPFQTGMRSGYHFDNHRNKF